MPTLSAEWKPGTSKAPFIMNDPIRNGAYTTVFVGRLFACVCLLDLLPLWKPGRHLDLWGEDEGSSFWLDSKASGL